MNARLIILEGPDCTGKTWLAQQIVNHVGQQRAIYIHLGPMPERELYELQLSSLMRAVEGNKLCPISSLRFAITGSEKMTVIIDRHWISEQIYGKVYRAEEPAMTYAARQMDRLIRTLGGLYVFCLPSQAVYEAGYHRTAAQQIYPMDERVTSVYQRYHQLLQGVKRPPEPAWDDYVDYLMSQSGGMLSRDDVLWYDYVRDGTRSKIDSFVGLVLTRVEQLQHLSRLNPARRGMLGRLPKPPASSDPVLFVGERINPLKETTRSYPFVDNGHSSRFLADALQWAQFDESRGFWINILESEEDQLSVRDAVLAWRRWPRIIAFGNVAASILATLERDHIPVMHPSFAKRFNRYDEFVDQLQEALACQV
jgi:thymidylate kinase